MNINSSNRTRRSTDLIRNTEYPIIEPVDSQVIADGTINARDIIYGSITREKMVPNIQRTMYDDSVKYGLLSIPFNPLPSEGLTLTFTILPDNINGGIVRINWGTPYLHVFGASFDRYLIYIKDTSELSYNAIQYASIIFGVNTFTFTGLTNGLSHSVKIKSYNNTHNTSSLDIEATNIIPRRFPYSPSGFGYLSRQDSIVNLSWTSLTGIQTGGSDINSYRIKYTIGLGNTEYFENTTSNTPSLFINNLTNGEYYYFKVAGVNSFNELGDYSQQLAYRPIGTPGLPAISSTTPGDTIVNIVAIPPSYTGGINVNLLGYHVYYKINGTQDIESNWTQSRNSLTSLIFPNTNITISGLINGTKYDFRIKALNEINDGSYVNVLNIRPRGTPSSSTINNLIPSNGAVNLSWTSPIDRGGVAISELIYNIIYGTTNTTVPSGTTISPGVFTTSDASYIITGLTNGTTYYFWVKASNGLYFSNSSVSNSTPRTIPGVVSSLTVQSGSNTPTITLAWGLPANNGGASVTEYNIYVNNSLNPITITGTTYSVTNLPARSNNFRVHAVNVAGEGAATTISANVINIPEAVGSLTASGSNTPTITLAWSTPPDSGANIIRYDIYVNDLLYTNTSANTINYSSLYHGSKKFGIRAINSVNFQGPISEIDATVTNVPGEVSSLTASGSNTPTITLAWGLPVNNGGAGVTGYNIYVNGSLRTTITGTTYSVTSLPAGINNFRVHAVNVIGEGAATNISANVVNVPPMPQDFIAQVNSPVVIGNIQFNWGPVTNPTTNTDYMIQSRNVSYNWPYFDFESIDNSIFTSRSYSVQYPADYRNLQYSFRIRRITEGLESYSNESSVVTIPNPGFRGTVIIGPSVPSGLYDYIITTPQGVELGTYSGATANINITNSPAGLSQLVIKIKRKGTYYAVDTNPHALGTRISSNVIFDSPLSGYNYVNNILSTGFVQNEILFAPRIYSEHLFNSVVSLSFEVVTLPNAPTNIKNSIESNSSIKISWDLPTGTVSNIILSYRRNLEGTHHAINTPNKWFDETIENDWINITLSSNTITHTLNNLVAGKWYTFRTRSVINVGGRSYPGKFSSSNIFAHYGNTVYYNWSNGIIPTSIPELWNGGQAAISCSAQSDFLPGTLNSYLIPQGGRSGASTPNFPNRANMNWLINFSYPYSNFYSLDLFNIPDLDYIYNILSAPQKIAFRIMTGSLYDLVNLPSSYDIYVTNTFYNNSYSTPPLLVSISTLRFVPSRYNLTIRAYFALEQNNIMTPDLSGSWTISRPLFTEFPNTPNFLIIKPKNIIGEAILPTTVVVDVVPPPPPPTTVVVDVVPPTTVVVAPSLSIFPKIHLEPLIFRIEIDPDLGPNDGAIILRYIFKINPAMLGSYARITSIKMDFIRNLNNFTRSNVVGINTYTTFTANYSSLTASVSNTPDRVWFISSQTNDVTFQTASVIGTYGTGGPHAYDTLALALHGNRAVHVGQGGFTGVWWGAHPIAGLDITYAFNVVLNVNPNQLEIFEFIRSSTFNYTPNFNISQDPRLLTTSWPQLIRRMFRIKFTVGNVPTDEFTTAGDSYYPSSISVKSDRVITGPSPPIVTTVF